MEFPNFHLSVPRTGGAEGTGATFGFAFGFARAFPYVSNIRIRVAAMNFLRYVMARLALALARRGSSLREALLFFLLLLSLAPLLVPEPLALELGRVVERRGLHECRPRLDQLAARVRRDAEARQ